MGKTIAFTGKGGVGKTALSAICGKILIGKGERVLFIDADPAMGLATALNVKGYTTIGQAREEIIRQVRTTSPEDDKAPLAEIIDYLLLTSLHEAEGYSLIVMGQTDTLGCFCSLNSLLKDTISSISEEYDWIIIDAEAGFEQVNRQVMNTVQFPVIVSDNTMRGVKTASMIMEAIDRIPSMTPLRTGLIFNRVEKAEPQLVRNIKSAGINYYGHVPADSDISRIDLDGTSILDISCNSVSMQNMERILSECEILQPT